MVGRSDDTEDRRKVGYLNIKKTSVVMYLCTLSGKMRH